MASITKRGPYQYQAIIRRKGYDTQTKTFETRDAAEAWAGGVESKMYDGQFRDPKAMATTTLAMALERYMKEVTPGSAALQSSGTSSSGFCGIHWLVAR